MQWQCVYKSKKIVYQKFTTSSKTSEHPSWSHIYFYTIPLEAPVFFVIKIYYCINFFDSIFFQLIHTALK